MKRFGHRPAAVLHQPATVLHRPAAVLALAIIGAVSVTACSSGSSSGGTTGAGSGGHVTITVGCEPPKTQAAQRNFFLQDVAAFEKANPDVTVTGDDTNPCDDPTTFDAKLASGKMDNVFYTYFTDAANVISSGQAADISKYAGQVKNLSSIQPDLVNLYRQGGAAGGDLYGVPVSNYTLGLLTPRCSSARASTPPSRPPPGPRCAPTPGRSALSAAGPPGTATTARPASVAGISPPSSTPSADRW